MKEPRTKETSGLGYEQSSTTEEGESSKSLEQRNAKSKGKPTCHYYGKIEHAKNICRSKNGKKNPKAKPSGNFSKCKKVGHQAHECRT